DLYSVVTIDSFIGSRLTSREYDVPRVAGHARTGHDGRRATTSSEPPAGNETPAAMAALSAAHTAPSMPFTTGWRRISAPASSVARSRFCSRDAISAGSVSVMNDVARSTT